MAGFVLRTLITALGIGLAAALVPGIRVEGGATLLLAALLLGFVNAIVRPVAILLTLPLTLMTLGLFLLVVNAAMLGLVAWMLEAMTVGGFFSAVAGALIVGATSAIASWYVGPRGRFEVLIVERHH